MRDIRVGLAGYGMGGSVFHAPLIRSVRGLSLATVVTSRRAAVVRDMPGVHVASSVDELLGDATIDLIVISTPTDTHFDIARAAIQANKHVVVDKPFATTAAEADTLMRLAASKGVFLSVYQNRRWDGDFRTVEQCVRQGSLGTVYYYEAHYDRFRLELKPGWREESETASGILYDLGAHVVDQALVLFGMPQAVTADAFRQRPVARSVDYFHMVLDYGRRRAVLHVSTLVRAPGPRFQVHGDGGSFLKSGADPQEQALMAGGRPGDAGWGMDTPANYGEFVSADGSRRRIETLPGCYQRYYELVAESLRSRRPPPVDPADSRNGLIVIKAAMRSAAERRTVAIGECD